MKNEIKSVGHHTHCHGNARKWHPYQDFLDILDTVTVKENRVSSWLFI